jgi:hypothetical protein
MNIPDKIWLFLILAVLLAIFVFQTDSGVLQKWIEYALIALIAVLRGGSSAAPSPAAPAMTIFNFSGEAK